MSSDRKRLELTEKAAPSSIRPQCGLESGRGRSPNRCGRRACGMAGSAADEAIRKAIDLRASFCGRIGLWKKTLCCDGGRLG